MVRIVRQWTSDEIFDKMLQRITEIKTGEMPVESLVCLDLEYDVENYYVYEVAICTLLPNEPEVLIDAVTKFGAKPPKFGLRKTRLPPESTASKAAYTSRAIFTPRVLIDYPITSNYFNHILLLLLLLRYTFLLNLIWRLALTAPNINTTGTAPSASEPCASHFYAIEIHSPDNYKPTENECIEPEASQNKTICSKAEGQANVPNIPANKPISLPLLRSLYLTYPDSELQD